MSLLGIDIGTSGCKATIVDYDGNVLGQAHKEYALVSPAPDQAELDPDLVWNSVKDVVKRAVQNSGGCEVKAASVSSFGEAVIPIDNKGRVLHNSIIYIDIRGQDEAQYLKNNLGNKKVLGITGASIHSMYGICKIMWLKKHKPEIYHATWKFLLFADFVLFKLGASPHTDFSLAARTMAFDIVKKQWSQEILNCVGIDQGKFGEPVQGGTVVGKISATVAEDLGLSKDLILASGGHDQPCAALGAGVIMRGLAVDGLGTTECITPTFERPIISDLMSASCFACVPHVIKDMYVTYAFTFTSGSVLRWYRDNFAAVHTGNQDNKENLYSLLIRKATKEPSNIFILPHFAGAATPYMDTESSGAILGLSINTKPEDIIKAILEGITFEIMVNIDKLDEAGIKINELRAVGGLSQSDEFLQLKANMMNREVSTLKISEAGTLGVAILAGTATGIYKTITEAVDNLVVKEKIFYPDDKINRIYTEKFQTYKHIYPSLKNIFRTE